MAGFSIKEYIPKKNFFPPNKYEKKLKLNPDHLRKLALREINPNDKCKTWDCLGINDPTINVFLFSPGDYRRFGELKISTSGRENQYRFYITKESLSSQGKAKLPYNKSNSALIENFMLQNADYCVLKGFKVNGKSRKSRGGKPNRILNSSFNVLDQIVIEYVASGNSLIITNSSYNHIQNSIIRNAIPNPNKDNVGIIISSVKGKESRENVICGNEIYNCTDAIHLLYHYKKKKKFGFIPGTVIDNNDLYVEKMAGSPKSAEYSCFENAIDIKVGSATTNEKDRTIITNNRMWGFRQTDTDCGSTGSYGPAIVLHNNAQNILIKNNIIFDSASGIIINSNKKEYGCEVKHITISNNLLFDFPRYSKGQAISVTETRADISFNSIFDAKRFLHHGSNAHLTNEDIKCNYLVNVRKKPQFQKNNVGKTNLSKSEKPYTSSQFEFYIKRLQGPEKISLNYDLNKKVPKRYLSKNCKCARDQANSSPSSTVSTSPN